MDISVHLATILQKNVISNLLELYSHDLSEILPDKNKLDVKETGRFEYPFLDKYWQEKDRFAYLIMVNNKIAGFALIHQNSVLHASQLAFIIAEFFVLRKYRRRGVGLNAAKYILHQHSGSWEIPVIKHNLKSFKFWLSVLNEKVKTEYQIIETKNKEWNGLVFSFVVNK